jgi:predicted secreted protein
MGLVKDADNGKTATLLRDDSLVVSLAATPGTGFGWRITESACLRQSAEPQFSPPPGGLAGAQQTETIVFQPVSAPCSGELDLAYSRPWEQVAPARTFRLSILVK